MLRDPGAHAAHPAHGIGKRQAARGARQQRLGWHAADVETVSAHRVPLDQRHLGAESGGRDSRDETRGPGANDGEVVT